MHYCHTTSMDQESRHSFLGPLHRMNNLSEFVWDFLCVSPENLTFQETPQSRALWDGFPGMVPVIEMKILHPRHSPQSWAPWDGGPPQVPGLSQPASTCWPSCHHLKAPLGKDLPLSSHGCWPDSLLCLLFTRCCPLGSLSFGFLQHGSLLRQSKRPRKQWRDQQEINKVETIVFYNLIMKPHPQNFAILCRLEASHFVQYPIQGRTLHAGTNPGRWGLWVTSEVYLKHPPLGTSFKSY